MSLENPTDLRLGLRGQISGRNYRIAGRIVLGTEDAGQTYYWNEFHLVEDSGEEATLVYEVGEEGPEWKIFRLTEPANPLSAAEAGSKRVGDRVNIDGEDIGVTLVGQSRVHFIEGEAPEGVELGDVAHYFNADAGGELVVVSWTGDEVEYYRGIPVPAEMLASAFPVVLPSVSHLSGPTPGGFSVGRYLLPVIVAGTFGLACFLSSLSCHSTRSGPVVSKWSAPAAPLALGSSGRLGGTPYRVAAHTVMETAQTEGYYDRQEYQLIDDTGNRALLVYGWKFKSPEWVLFRPVQPLVKMTPQRTAALQLGNIIEFEGFSVVVQEQFQTTVRRSEAHSGLVMPEKVGDRYYNFSGQNGDQLLLARWNEAQVSFYQGKVIPSKEVKSIFAKGADR